MSESISQFMKRRAREVARFGHEAEAVAREAYGHALRAKQDLKLSSPGEVMRHGAKLLQEKAHRAAATASNATQQFRRLADEAARRASRDPTVRFFAADAVRKAGNAAGVVRGGVHAVQGLAEGAAFVGRVVNPLDPLLSPRGESAAQQLVQGGANAARGAVDYVTKGIADPKRVVRDFDEMGQQWRRALDPTATPAAPTFEGDLRRNLDIGQNQGELAFDVGSLVVGGPAAKAVKGLPRVSNVGNVERYAAQGFSPRAAAHLAEPYPLSNMGSHFVPRDTKLPEFLGGGPLPKSYIDSAFNVLKPEGISRGDFYEIHYKVDPRFHGTGVIPGEPWRGSALGLNKYGPAGRVWHGSPPALKARVGGLGASAGRAMYAHEEEDIRW